MSSSLITPHRDSLFKTHLVNQDEEKKNEPAEENTVEPTAIWTDKVYTPQRASFHTARGKIRRFFA